jgi:hypothetical protein
MVEFDEIAIRDEFISHIQEVFAKEYDLIGSEVEVAPRESQEATYPCCLVNVINPTSAERYADSGGTYNYINLSINCDLFSNKLDNFSLDDSIIKLSQILIKGVLEKYSNIVVTRNSGVPFRTDVLRRTVTFRFTYDHINKIIYSN